MTVDYSVIIPAYNEERFLPATLERLKEAMAATPARGEIIVVDNNSSDATPRIAGEFGATVVFEAVNQISRARNCGARQARGKYLIFLDADTAISGDLLGAALGRLSSGMCCGGGVLVQPDREPPAAARYVMAFWNRVSMNMGLAAGCFIFCLREAFQQTGGFSERVYASEEIWLSRKLRAWGRGNNMRFDIIDEYPVTTSLRKLQWYSPPKLIMLSLPILLFPPAVFFKGLCSTWYRRPGRDNKV